MPSKAPQYVPLELKGAVHGHPQTLLSLSLILSLTLALTHPVTLAVVLGLTLTLVCSPRA